ncbi:hypothetical protein CDV31_016672 [Fusarium ambrosium]|uniref:Uncharacterized protein n=1 Tax=Fusarium ambrosium TaxID=131363 RepID=A0A428S4J9_9HYPO|nr:hypothetical protein CDV31_016672 [Fusarium ambrosium]
MSHNNPDKRTSSSLTAFQGSLSGNKRHEDSPDDRQDDIRPGNDRREDSHDERQDENCGGNKDGCCIMVLFSQGKLPPRRAPPPPQPAPEPVLEESGDEDNGREEQGDEGYGSDEQGGEERVSD